MTNRQIRWHLILDLVSFFGMGIADMLFHVIPIKPVKRGFFCDDKSIQKPLQEETIPTWVVLLVGFLVTIPVIVICEVVNHRQPKSGSKRDSEISTFTVKCGPIIWKPLPWQKQMIFRIFMFIFGALITNLFTDIGKVTVGRLCPYFMTTCRPNATLLNCSMGFITSDVCTGNAKDVIDARMCFPSVHSSFSAYSMVFLVLYLESSMPTKKTNLLKPFAQVTFLSLGLLCSLTRVFDYLYHWEDVVVGMLLGTLVAFFITFRALRLFTFTRCPHCQSADETDHPQGDKLSVEQDDDQGLDQGNDVIPL